MKEERAYTAAEIRKAGDRTASTGAAEIIIKMLRFHDAEHAFSDDDTITVAELRGAWERVGAEVTLVSDFLRDISEHREPEYEDHGVYRDARGEYYKRRGDCWLKFGDSCLRNHSVPVRPLEEMP